MDLFSIKNVSQFVADETVETGLVGIQFGIDLPASHAIPLGNIFKPFFPLRFLIMFSYPINPCLMCEGRESCLSSKEQTPLTTNIFYSS